MKTSKKTFSLIATSLFLSANSPINTDIDEFGDLNNLIEKERCYCIVKSGQNDCANSTGSHRCATYATKSADCGEWILLPKGTCKKLVSASTEPRK